jgi:hypothetical protein
MMYRLHKKNYRIRRERPLGGNHRDPRGRRDHRDGVMTTPCLLPSPSGRQGQTVRPCKQTVCRGKQSICDGK